MAHQVSLPALIARAGPLLYGPRWQTPLAAALGVTRWSMRQMVTFTSRSTPAAIGAALADLIEGRIAALASAMLGDQPDGEGSPRQASPRRPRGRPRRDQSGAAVAGSPLAARASTVYGPEWQSQLAADYGCDRSAVARWAAGRHRPPANLWLLIAAVARRRQAALALILSECCGTAPPEGGDGGGWR